MGAFYRTVTLGRKLSDNVSDFNKLWDKYAYTDVEVIDIDLEKNKAYDIQAFEEGVYEVEKHFEPHVEMSYSTNCDFMDFIGRFEDENGWDSMYYFKGSINICAVFDYLYAEKALEELKENKEKFNAYIESLDDEYYNHFKYIYDEFMELYQTAVDNKGIINIK